MTPTDFYASMCRALDAKVLDIVARLASGQAQDFAQYRNLVGQMTATKDARTLLSETYNKMFEEKASDTRTRTTAGGQL